MEKAPKAKAKGLAMWEPPHPQLCRWGENGSVHVWTGQAGVGLRNPLGDPVGAAKGQGQAVLCPT